MFEEYVDEFVISKEMQEFLKKPHDSVDNIADVIYYAPRSLKHKKEALLRLLEEIKSTENHAMVDDCEMYLKSINEAERLIDEDGVFSVEICRYENKKGDNNYDFDGLFNSYNDLIKYVEENLNDCEITNDMPWCYTAVKWINDENGRLVEACTYWIVRAEVWFAQVEDYILQDFRLDVYRALDLNIPVPFMVGDIVEIDLYPFADKRIIEIIEIGDNRDCCSLQAMGKIVEGGWTIGAVKHGHIGIDVLPCVSPLYTMTLYTGELKPDYKILKVVQNYIHGDEERGTIFWDALSFKDEISDEDIESVIKMIRNGAK